MNMATTDTPYCRLYIDTRETRGAVQALLDALASAAFSGLHVEAEVLKNDGHSPGPTRSKPYDPIEASQWTAEINAEDGSIQAIEAFQAGTSAMIVALREAGFLVTASCDFEDRVISETGWNWTRANPRPAEGPLRVETDSRVMTESEPFGPCPEADPLSVLDK